MCRAWDRAWEEEEERESRTKRMSAWEEEEIGSRRSMGTGSARGECGGRRNRRSARGANIG